MMPDLVVSGVADELIHLGLGWALIGAWPAETAVIRVIADHLRRDGASARVILTLVVCPECES